MSAITVTLKMDRKKKKTFYDYCHEQGLMVNKFFENAAENEIERRLIAQSADIFKNYQEREKTAVDFDKVVKQLKIKRK